LIRAEVKTAIAPIWIENEVSFGIGVGDVPNIGSAFHFYNHLRRLVAIRASDMTSDEHPIWFAIIARKRNYRSDY